MLALWLCWSVCLSVSVLTTLSSSSKLLRTYYYSVLSVFVCLQTACPMVFTAHRAKERLGAAQAEAAAGQPRLWEGRPAGRMMMSSPFRRGLCTGSSFQQTLRQRMREVSPPCPAGCLTPAPSRAAATSSPGVASPLRSGRVRKRGGGAGGPRAAQGRARVPTKTQAGAAAPDGRPPAAVVRGVQLPLAALHDGSLPQGQRLPAREVRAALPSHPPPRTCPPGGAQLHPTLPTLARSRRVYQPESLDLLYRHYYKNFRFG